MPRGASPNALARGRRVIGRVAIGLTSVARSRQMMAHGDPRRRPAVLAGVATERPMKVLGFNCNVFNSAAALVVDGQLVAAAQEERFTRRKHTGDFPENAIRYCLAEGGLTLRDLDVVGFHWVPLHHFHRRLWQIVQNLPDSVLFWGTHAGRWSNMVLVPWELERRFPVGGGRPRYRFERVRHHVCHAASAYLASPFEEAALLTVDGSGEMATSTLGVGRGREIRLFQETFFPHSLGYLYVALTHYLGFIPDSDEYKVMALASYGGPDLLPRFRRLVRCGPAGTFELDLSYFAFQRGIRDPWVSPRFVREFGPLRRRGEPLEQRHYDVAFALQRTLEETVLHLARHLHARTGLRRLCYAGGTALNSVLNARLLRETPFTEVFVQPAANDAGTAIGSALYLDHGGTGGARRFVMRDAALGPAYSDQECRRALEAAGYAWRELTEEERTREVARLIAAGAVVGWFEGRMEMGPRALGHRSILADPRRPEMKDTINAKVKHRESFRPFAPAVLEEAAGDFFDWKGPSPFMLFVAKVRAEKRDVIPAVLHVDETARLQTVSRDVSPAFWDLIKEFERLTGVPVVLNTSFNVMGEPIVCTPADAVACFRSTAIDALLLNRLLVTR
jgi:carbamoyltransferase